jgi:cathepsin F
MSPAFRLLETKQVDVQEDESRFQKYINEYHKSYINNAAGYEQHLAIFKDNLKEIKKMQESDKGTATYGVNEFADMSKEEFLSTRAMPLGWPESDIELPQATELPLGDTPATFDWREKDVVTEVKNQGSCGSCWAFSTTGNIEGQWAIHHQKLISLSEQELVDCDKVDKGCEGGLPSNAYQAIMKLGGLETEADYPYRGEDMTCTFNKSKVVVNINGSITISSDENQMAAWLAAYGPISIGINAAAMQFYMGGISDPWSILCNPDHLDHGVLIVGYGEDDGKPFWIIKNSWGPDWGEKGYYRIIRGKGKCGLNKMPTSATVA